MSTNESPLGPVVYAYTRAMALADGVLVDITAEAKKAGFRLPVAMTETVWTDCVEWTEETGQRKGVYQDQSARLWDVLWMARLACVRAGQESRASFQVARVPVAGQRRSAEMVELVAHIGPGDAGEPVITLMFPNED